MATWISSFFDIHNEIARDVYNEYLDSLKFGLSGRKATKVVLDGFVEEIHDTEGDGPVVWMALAVTQWKYGRLEPRVKAKALRIIKDGGDVAAYPPELQKRWSKVLEKVRIQLESPQPPEKPIRVIKPAEPLKKIDKLWKPGQVVAFRRDSGRFVLLLTEGVDKHPYIGEIPYFVVLKWEGAKIPSLERILKLRPTNKVIGVYPNKKGAPIPWDRVERLEVVRDLTGSIRVHRNGVYREEGWDDYDWKELDAAF